MFFSVVSMLSLPPPENIYVYVCVFKYFLGTDLACYCKKMKCKRSEENKITNHFCCVTLFSVSFVHHLFLLNLSKGYFKISKQKLSLYLLRRQYIYVCMIYCTFWSNSALSTARLSTWRLNSWTCVRGFRDFSGSGIGSLPSLHRIHL